MTADELASEFTAFRPRLLSIAYRLLGSAWDADDIVADAMVRWMRVDRQTIHEPLAFLTTIVTRLALDQLRSARATARRYIGEWLPEPILTDPSPLGPLDTVERREAVSLATLRMMEALTPPERAVLVLHEAFDLTQSEIAGILDITEEGARQHLRGRVIISTPAPTFRPAVHDETLERFLTALENGDLDQVQDLLAADVVSYSDGGGKARAARRPIVGAPQVFQYLTTLRRQLTIRDVLTTARQRRDGRHVVVRAPVHGARPRRPRRRTIREIHWIMNPDKLRYLRRQLAAATPLAPPPKADRSGH